MTTQTLLTAREAAAYLGLSYGSFRTYLSTGRLDITPAQVLGRNRLYSVASLEAVKFNNLQTLDPEPGYTVLDPNRLRDWESEGLRFGSAEEAGTWAAERKPSHFVFYVAGPDGEVVGLVHGGRLWRQVDSGV